MIAKVWKIFCVSEGHQRANSVPAPTQTLYVIHNLSTAANELIHSLVDNSKIGLFDALKPELIP